LDGILGEITVSELGVQTRNMNSVKTGYTSQMDLTSFAIQNILSYRLLSRNIKVKIYKTRILLLVSYRCEIWNLTLREIGRLTAFERSVRRKIFRSKGNEVVGGWRKLHNEDLHNLYY
jgi:hypothetical protein